MTLTLKKCLEEIIMLYISKKKVTCGMLRDRLAAKGYPPVIVKKALSILALKIKGKHIRNVQTRVFSFKESFYYPEFLIKAVSKLFYKGIISLFQVEEILNNYEAKEIMTENDVIAEIKNKSYSYYTDFDAIKYC